PDSLISGLLRQGGRAGEPIELRPLMVNGCIGFPARPSESVRHHVAGFPPIWTPQARGSRGGANRVATSNGQRVYRLSRAPVGVGAPPRSRIPSYLDSSGKGVARGSQSSCDL